MAGTREGGLKAAAKNKANNPDHYIEAGMKGGKAQNGHGGFASKKKDKDGLTGPERARKYGAVGGANGRKK